MSYFSDVTQFHEAFHLPNPGKPTILDEETEELRKRLLDEELTEYAEAIEAGDLAGQCDAIVDAVYILLGDGVVRGLPIGEAWQLVQNANMAKLGPDGNPVMREDGKVLKPEGWEPPNIEGLLAGDVEPPMERERLLENLVIYLTAAWDPALLSLMIEETPVDSEDGPAAELLRELLQREQETEREAARLLREQNERIEEGARS